MSGFIDLQDPDKPYACDRKYNNFEFVTYLVYTILSLCHFDIPIVVLIFFSLAQI